MRILERMLGVKTLGKLKNKKGVSLAEMLVCVILVSLISMMTCTGILTSFRVGGQVSKAASVQSVSDTIMNRITGELSDSYAGDVYLAAGESPVVAFYGKSGAPMYITAYNKPDVDWNSRAGDAGKGYLMVYYCGALQTDGSVSPSIWTIDKGAYMGFDIDSLTFSDAGEKENHPLVKVKLKMKAVNGDKTYSAEKIICCYNLEASNMRVVDDVDKILKVENFSDIL